MSNPSVLVLSGYGLNCEDETLHAFTLAGAQGQRIHVNDLLAAPSMLKDTHILAIPGGFSFGDDTGSGNALAARLRERLGDTLLDFVERKRLLIGICNGAQVLVNLGLVPGLSGKLVPDAALLPNQSARYQCRWVHVQANSYNRSPWLVGLDEMFLPVAHGEGAFTLSPEALELVRERELIGGRYSDGNGHRAQGKFPLNPNGSVEDIAMMTDTTGRVLATMPHPERAVAFTQRPDWIRRKEHLKRAGDKLPTAADGLRVFKNAVAYYT
jgi:phosphoribosylformylglycinamidine synthase